MALGKKNSSVESRTSNIKRSYNNRSMAVVIAMVVTLASMFGIFSFESYLPSSMLKVIPLFLGVIVFMLFEVASRSDDESNLNKSLQRLISLFVPVSLALSSWFAVQSLWVYPYDTVPNRFALENLSTAFLVTGATLVLLLSTMQKDRFWITRRQQGSMDEREMSERQKVMERSYFFAVITGAGTLWAYLGNISAVNEINRIDNSLDVLPGHYFFPGYCAVVLLFSLPLIIAVWQKNGRAKK